VLQAEAHKNIRFPCDSYTLHFIVASCNLKHFFRNLLFVFKTVIEHVTVFLYSLKELLKSISDVVI